MISISFTLCNLQFLYFIFFQFSFLWSTFLQFTFLLFTSPLDAQFLSVELLHSLVDNYRLDSLTILLSVSLHAFPFTLLLF